MSSEYLKNFNTIFWDFDGVIKDSVLVKSDAFKSLFSEFGDEVALKVKRHHEENGGMSRFDKLPIYIKWSGQALTSELVDEYEKRFSTLVKQQVINSNWVDGVLNYLSSNYNRQNFFLISATPQNEIDEITEDTSLNMYFHEIFGSPIEKSQAIKLILGKYDLECDNCAMIGDSYVDYKAALNNKIAFILRRTLFNRKIQKTLKCTQIDNFL